jgi:hypothetical protein
VNVAFHELAGVALAQETAAWLEARPPTAPPSRVAWLLAVGLAVLSHGILDALPHYYPLPSAVDVAVSLALVAGGLAAFPRGRRWWLLAVCLAAVLPDIIDHVPDDLHRHVSPSIPVPPNLFPWHWLTGSGSLTGRTGPLWRESLTNHVIVVAFCAVAIVRTRHVLRPWAARS